MTRKWRLGLRARFLAAGILLVLTTVAASTWTLFVLSRLASVAATTVRDTDETTAATAGVTSALEREDDALLVILGGEARGFESLQKARSVTDRARHRLRQDSPSGTRRSMATELDVAVVRYRTSVDGVVSAPGEKPLERYHREANPLLRLAVAAVGKARDERFAEARALTTLARDEVTRARRVVLVISVVAVAIAAAVALRLARHIILPMRQLSNAAQAIRDGNFATQVDLIPADEIGRVSEAFNEMTRRLAEFHRSNLGEVLRAKGTLEATMRALPDALLLIDAEGSVVATNPAAELLFDRLGSARPSSAEQLAVLGAASSDFQEALLGQQAFARVALDASLRIDLEGDARRYLPRIVPLALGPERSGIVLVLSDVTELARLDEMRTALVAVASHELRTPVTTLRMSLLMLREAADRLDVRVRDLIQTALGGVEQLGETVDELLDVTRIEAGRLRLNADAVDMVNVVKEVVGRSNPRAEELGLTFEVQAPNEVPSIVGDRARLRIVVDNLVGNALKYTPSGGSIQIRISSSSQAELAPTVDVAITDSGPGIPAEFRTRIFEKFFRVEHHRSGTEEAPRGSGIGLYLCKEIVELHGGHIHCETPEHGSGSRIAFSLPTRNA